MQANRRSRAQSVPNVGRDHHRLPSVVYDGSGTSYSVGALLGKGGFAKCYLAYADRQEFALKVITKDSIKKESYLNKIRKEINTHFKLRHPNIVTLYNTFEDGDNIYMLLEYCPNRTLAEYIECCTDRRVTESTAVIILKQLLKAVRYLHEDCEILHRDIKPGNILLSRENTVKLADFGFCCSITELERRRTHTVCGTPNYVSAEVLDRMGHSVYSESWSIACTFYCMLFGRPPFHSDCQEVTYSQIRKCNYVFPGNCNVSRDAKDFIARVLIRDRFERPTTAEMLQHSIFLNLNRCVSYANGLNQSVNLSLSLCVRYFDFKSGGASRCRRVSADFSSSGGQNDSSTIAKRFLPKNLLIDSGLGSGGDLCNGGGGPIALTNSETFTSGYTTTVGGSNDSRRWDARMIVSHYVSVLNDCMDSFDPLFLSPIDNDLCDAFVAKWVDYTNKFGFSVTLKDGTRSLLLNDNSIVAASHSNSRLIFCENKFHPTVQEWPSSSATSVNSHSVAEKFQFLSFLRAYMDWELYSFVDIGPSERADSQLFSFASSHSASRSGDVRVARSVRPSDTTAPNNLIRSHAAEFMCQSQRSTVTSSGDGIQLMANAPLPQLIFLVDVRKSSAGLLMILSDGTCQMNIADSRYKIVVCNSFSTRKAASPQVRVFFITPEHNIFGYEVATSYDLSRADPPDEFMYQVGTLKHALQQYGESLSSRAADSNRNASSNLPAGIQQRCAAIDSTAQRLMRLRSSTNC